MGARVVVWWELLPLTAPRPFTTHQAPNERCARASRKPSIDPLLKLSLQPCELRQNWLCTDIWPANRFFFKRKKACFIWLWCKDLDTWLRMRVVRYWMPHIPDGAWDFKIFKTLFRLHITKYYNTANIKKKEKDVYVKKTRTDTSVARTY